MMLTNLIKSKYEDGDMPVEFLSPESRWLVQTGARIDLVQLLNR